MHRDELGQRTLLSLFSAFLPVPPGSGTRIRDHFLPFQCRTRFSVLESDFPNWPTAQQLRAETQVTSLRKFCAVFPVPAGCGTRIAAHLRPFQRSIRLRDAPPL